MMHVGIRADGSHEIGLGHLYRSATVAREAVDRGHRVSVVTRTPTAAANVFPDSVSVVAVSGSEERPVGVEEFDRIGVDVVVSDCQAVTSEHQPAYAGLDAAFALVADDSPHQIHADVFLNGNVYATDLTYDWVGSEPEWCLGLDYLLLREPFRTRATEPRQFSPTVDEIVVTMGGVDKRDRTVPVLRGLASLNVSLTVVVGPAFENEREIRETATAVDTSVTVVRDPQDLPQLFERADVAVCTLGTTVYELFAVGTPVVGIPDNQTPIRTALTERDAAVVLPRVVTPDVVENTVTPLVKADSERKRLFENATALVTGGGQELFLDILEQYSDD